MTPDPSTRVPVMKETHEELDRLLKEDQFRALLEVAPDAILVIDELGRIVLINHQTEKLFGYSRNELLGQAIEILIPVRFREHHPSYRENFARSPHVRGMGEGRLLFGLRKEGTEFPVEISLSPLEANGNRYVISTVRDVTERKRIEETHRASQERFRILVDSVQDYAIYMLDANGHVLSWNAGAERIKGYKSEEIIGQHVSRFYPQESIHQGWPDEELRRARSLGWFEDEGWRIRKDGTQFWANVVITALKDDAGQVTGFSKVTRDLTERKRHEQTLRDKNIELEKASKAKDHFLANMSHELRTPLNAIIGFTGTLLMRLPGPLTADQEKQLKTVQTSARHLLSLINDLLDLSKIESGKVELQPESIRCVEVVQEIMSALRPSAEKKGLAFELNMSSEDLIVIADRRSLRQIMFNLINNAIKFTEQGSIFLKLCPVEVSGNRMIAFRVIDTGIGIKSEDYDRLFQAFSQVDTNQHRRHEGTGLGLHLSKKLAELLGGEIQFESEYQRGSTFILTLPEA